MIRRSFVANTIAMLAALSVKPALARSKQIDWNDRELKWSKPSEGLLAMKRGGANGLLVVFAEWCPVCHEYSKTFHDSEVVAALRDVTVMRIDQDGSDKLVHRFTPDGEYVPLTFFLGSDGKPISDLYESDPKFKYFFPPDHASDLAMLIRAMVSKSRGE